MSQDTQTKKREKYLLMIWIKKMELIGQGASAQVFKTQIKSKECALKLIKVNIKIQEENGLKQVYVPIEYVKKFTRELLFNMLVHNPKYLVEFLGHTIYSIQMK